MTLYQPVLGVSISKFEGCIPGIGFGHGRLAMIITRRGRVSFVHFAFLGLVLSVEEMLIVNRS